MFQSDSVNECVCEVRRTVADSYLPIVNLKEADIDGQIQVSKPPMVKVGENILGWKRKDTKTILIQETCQILNVL